MNFRNNVLFNQNELQLPVAGNLAAAPASPKPGQFYFDTAALTAMFHNGTSFVPADASKLVGTIPNAALLTNPLARANHTGTQPSATISDLAAVVKAYTLDTFAAPAASVAFNGKTITGLGDPVGVQDGATKNYVDNNIQLSTLGIASKPAVAVVAVANQAALTGLPTIDGITLSAGQRILLVGQTTTTQNGPYVVAAGAWARASGDPSGGNELGLGAFWFVEQGTVYGASQWRLATPTSGAITPGTTPVTITQFGQAITYLGATGVNVTGTTISGVALALGGIVAGASGFYLDTTIAARKYSTNVGDGSSLSYTLTHNLGTLDIVVAIRDAAGNAQITDWQAATINTAIITFSVAPTANQYRATVLG
jgi:hypothetical protein